MPEEGDSFDVAELFEEATPQQEQPPTPDPEIQALKAQNEELAKRVAAQEQWKQDAAKVFSGDSQPDQTQAWAATLMDPAKVDNLIEQKVNQRLA